MKKIRFSFTVAASFLISNTALAQDFVYHRADQNSPVSHIEIYSAPALDVREARGWVNVEAAARAYNTQTTQLKRYPFHVTFRKIGTRYWEANGHIELDYRDYEGGPVLLKCRFPIRIFAQVENPGANQTLRVWSDLAGSLPTANVDVSSGCPTDPVFTKLTKRWGPSIFKM